MNVDTNQKRKGAVMMDGDGRKWRKVDTIDADAFARAVADAHFAARIGTMTDDHLRAMGWELEEDGR